MAELDENEFRWVVRERQLKENFKQAESALLASVVYAGILAYFVYEVVPIDRLVLWGQFMGAVAAVRYLLIYAYRNTTIKPERIIYWRSAFVATLVFSGLAWGSADVLISPERD